MKTTMYLDDETVVQIAKLKVAYLKEFHKNISTRELVRKSISRMYKEKFSRGDRND